MSIRANCSVVINDYLYLDIFPAPDWFGVVNVTLMVSDGGVTVTDTFQVNVIPEPDPPQFKETTFIIYATEDEELSYFVDAYDPDGQDVTFSDDTGLFDINPATGEIKFTPTQEHVNNSPYLFNVTLSDGDSETKDTKQQFQLIVQNTPDPPYIFPVSKKYGKVNETFSLTIKAVDVDSDELYFYDDTTMFVIDINTGKILFTPNPKDFGSHIIKIIVSDEDYNSANITFELQINASDYVPPDNGNVTLSDGDGINMLLVVGVFLIIIIILIIFAFLILRRRKQKSELSSADPSDKYFTSDFLEEDLSHDEQISEDSEPQAGRIKKDITPSRPPGIKKGATKTPPTKLKKTKIQPRQAKKKIK